MVDITVDIPINGSAITPIAMDPAVFAAFPAPSPTLPKNPIILFQKPSNVLRIPSIDEKSISPEKNVLTVSKIELKKSPIVLNIPITVSLN